MNSSPSQIIQKNIVLVGAGNAHLRFLKMHEMAPIPGVTVTLINDMPVVPYSAMVPGYITRDYQKKDVTIDLVRLCANLGVRLVVADAEGMNTENNLIQCKNRPDIRYDVVSLGIGSLPIIPESLRIAGNSIPMRPLGQLIQQLDLIEEQLRINPKAYNLVLVGGGASGCELSLAIGKRFANYPSLQITLIHNQSRLMNGFPEKVAKQFLKLMIDRGIKVYLESQISGGNENFLDMGQGNRLAYDAVIWATNAGASNIISKSGLTTNPDGFLLVKDTLQSVSEPSVFGTGDCISLQNHPGLSKNGVYAVRQGLILFENIRNFLFDRSLIPFKPQRICLSMLNTSDSEGILSYGPISWKSRLIRKLKDYIDRRWMENFQTLQAADTPINVSANTPAMRCGGCGSKVAGDVLSAVLKRIDTGKDQRILFGCDAADDAAVYRMQPELYGKDPSSLVEVQTVDHFKSFTDDPYLFGQVAALHAVSDLYAMNARPFSALAIATLPYGRGPIQEGMLFELLTGAVTVLRRLGITLAGGHTTEGSELALGFSVTGFAEEDRLFTKSRLQTGDCLVLTKPIGTGALLAAWMRGECNAEWLVPLKNGMLQANDKAAQVFAKFQVSSCTDVTGFGLAGHLLEMLDASDVSASLDYDSVKCYPGFLNLAKSGILSTLHPDNAKTGCRILCQEKPPEWLFDPQTSGGLIAGVKEKDLSAVLKDLHGFGYTEACCIGKIISNDPVNKPSIYLAPSVLG